MLARTGFPALLLALTLAATAAPALAEDPFANPTGRLLTVSQNTLVFSAPPGGFRSMASLEAVVTMEGGALKYYPAQPKANDPNNYQLSEPRVLPAQAFEVIGFRDVVQGKETVRWLEVSPVGQPGITGWIAYGSRARPDTTLTLQ